MSWLSDENNKVIDEMLKKADEIEAIYQQDQQFWSANIKSVEGILLDIADDWKKKGKRDLLGRNWHTHYLRTSQDMMIIELHFWDKSHHLADKIMPAIQRRDYSGFSGGGLSGGIFICLAASMFRLGNENIATSVAYKPRFQNFSRKAYNVRTLQNDDVKRILNNYVSELHSFGDRSLSSDVFLDFEVLKQNLGEMWVRNNFRPTSYYVDP